MTKVWWRCVDGHVFEAEPPQAGGLLTCPGFDDVGRCDTSLIFMPYPTQGEAAGGEIGHGEAKWAPWARGTPPGADAGW